MDLPAHYDKMWATAQDALRCGEAEQDPLIFADQDNRRGLTLLTRPPASVLAMIDHLAADLRRLEPDQYVYPAGDIHVTILSIISCYEGFTLDLIDATAYTDAVNAVLRSTGTGPFGLHFSGVGASPGSVVVQGFPLDDGLEALRRATRSHFQHSGLPQSIDLRYRLQTAHSTVMRFATRPANPNRLLEYLKEHRDDFIGAFEVNTVELVYNDWYQRAANTVSLGQWALPLP